MERRNYVIDRMVEDGYITTAEGDEAKAEPLGVVVQADNRTVFSADYFQSPYADYFRRVYADQISEYGGVPIEAGNYFTEEVRRQLIDMYGEDEVYTGGLSVRTSLNPDMQIMARKALMDGLISYDEAHGWRGPVDTIDISDDWGPPLGAISPLADLFEWRLAVVLSTDGTGATVGLQPGRNGDGSISDSRETAVIPRSESSWAGNDALHPGDVVYVERVSDGVYHLHQVPEINGSIVAMDPQTGRVLAMVGGFSFSASQFNRATQAYRQPGSSFKPFVYAAALDNGYTLSSVVMDAPIEVVDETTGNVWRPENYSNRYYGPSTLRTGIEQSRNVMTVRLAQDMGMPLVVEYARRFGVYDNLPPYLSMALGSGETTVMRMVAGYAVLDNGGRAITPTLIDRVQDRNGNTIYESDQRVCNECGDTAWNNQAEPVIQDDRAQVLDPMTAYQVTSMLQGVVQRGTATTVQAVGRPVAGKTGTTNDYHDAWFVGYSPDLVVGVYIGYDTPRNLGTGNTGGVLAAPVFTEFMKTALADSPPTPFTMPPGMQLIPIDRSTGLRVSADDPNAFLEAFKPGTSPPDNFAIIGYVDAAGAPLIVDPNADRAVGLGQGGLY